MKKILNVGITAAVVVSVISAYYAYSHNFIDEYSGESMVIDNIQALSSGENDNDEMIDICGQATKKCWKAVWKSTKPCDNADHPKSCKVSHYSYSGGTKTLYEYGGSVKKSIFIKYKFKAWKSYMASCNYSNSAQTPVNGSQPGDSYFHSCQAD